jgi:hypothetical protein
MPFSHWCVLCGPAGAADFGANVLLFVPLGLGLGLSGVPWRRATLLAALMSGGIELAQLLVIPGRYATLGDVLANTAGGAFGAAFATHRRRWLRPRPHRAATLGAGAGGAFVAVLAASAWMLTVPDEPLPWSPRAEPATPIPTYGWFRGTVRRATVGDFATGSAGPGPLVVAAPSRRTVTASVEVQGWERPAPVPTPMLLVHRPGGAPAAPWLLLARSGNVFTFEAGARGRRFRLRQPVISLRAEPGRGWPSGGEAPDRRAWRAQRRLALGKPYTLTAALSGDHVALEFAWDGTPMRRSGIRLAPTLGWTLLSPVPTVESPEAGLTTAAWLAALALPMGYCLRWAVLGRRARLVASAGLLGTIGVGLVLAPLAWGFSIARWWEWVAAVGGAAAGVVLADLVRRGAPTTSAASGSAQGGPAADVP